MKLIRLKIKRLYIFLILIVKYILLCEMCFYICTQQTNKNTYKMKSVKKISGNNLGELLHLLNELDTTILNKYSHVSMYLPSVIIDTIKKAKQDINIELDKRENTI